ncbi:hypothetical protein ABT160_39990 [Streptomyces sp. NPDC001941]|uniref:hypothetical protein n=1 Tax=Streptomyces sp. NPDC001941 TaxID=3154659 RepID=UPI00331A0AE8
MTKWFKNVEYAESADEADKLLKEFCDSIGFAKEYVSTTAWKHSVDLACAKDSGLDGAKGTLLADQRDIADTARRKARVAAIAAEKEEIIGQIDGVDDFDDHVVAIFKQVCAQYEAGGQVDMTYGQSVSRAVYDGLRPNWSALAKVAAACDGPLFTGLSSMAIENKEEKGKGSVGGTLERRKNQGNFFIRVNNVRFNIHINIE